MSGVVGFFGSIVGLIAAAISGAVALTIIVILWRSGALPELIGWGTAVISGAFGLLGDFFGYLRDLLTFATG